MAERIIGEIKGHNKGPLIILVGGLHGNEKAGVLAIENVMQKIKEKDVPIRGHIYGIRGNLKALNLNRRFIDYDLNRCWTEKFVKYLETHQGNDLRFEEDQEAWELFKTLKSIDHDNHIIKIFVDLHTTSSDNGNFIVIPEDEANNKIVEVLKLPIVIDLDKYLEGTILQYMHQHGFLSFAFEGGLIGSENATTLHTAGIWELLKACGAVQSDHVNDFTNYDQIIGSFTRKLPHIVTVKYRHWVNEDDEFVMKEGYHNFQPVSKGEVLASDKKGIIKADTDGLIFMPLYQEAGNDGFFIVEEIKEKMA